MPRNVIATVMACECHDIGMSRWCTVTSCHAMSHCHFHCHEMSLLNEKMSCSVVPSPLFISSYLPSSHESLPHLISSLLKTIPCDITSYFLFSYQTWLYLSRRTSWHLISIACPYLISMPGSLHDPISFFSWRLHSLGNVIQWHQCSSSSASCRVTPTGEIHASAHCNLKRTGLQDSKELCAQPLQRATFTQPLHCVLPRQGRNWTCPSKTETPKNTHTKKNAFNYPGKRPQTLRSWDSKGKGALGEEMPG
jgi:hypothetical protein